MENTGNLKLSDPQLEAVEMIRAGSDSIDHPEHYAGDIECIDAMIQQFGVEKVKAFCLLNSFKYLWRCDKKHDTPAEDIGKSIWYLKRWEKLTHEG